MVIGKVLICTCACVHGSDQIIVPMHHAFWIAEMITMLTLIQLNYIIFTPHTMHTCRVLQDDR